MEHMLGVLAITTRRKTETFPPCFLDCVKSAKQLVLETH